MMIEGSFFIINQRYDDRRYNDRRYGDRYDKSFDMDFTPSRYDERKSRYDERIERSRNSRYEKRISRYDERNSQQYSEKSESRYSQSQSSRRNSQTSRRNNESSSRSQTRPYNQPPRSRYSHILNHIHQQTEYPSSIDDHEGHLIILNHTFLSDRYKIISLLGQGTFGKVVKAYDCHSQTHVAIKIIKAIQKYTDASKIEIKILEQLQYHDPNNLK
ncbi:hypothetical protein BC833DRAFT_1014 [Globomyces pollinis-pini]|nr:hypothetical protein BC833DRAFT_1014 [Globomyces pollinis-pini]